jgi:hypothetical protein
MGAGRQGTGTTGGWAGLVHVNMGMDPERPLISFREAGSLPLSRSLTQSLQSPGSTFLGRRTHKAVSPAVGHVSQH